MDERIAKFKGEIVTSEEMDVQKQNGKGGYAIRLNATSVLDCYKYLIS